MRQTREREREEVKERATVAYLTREGHHGEESGAV